MTGPYKDMPSHGIAYDVWAGLVQPETTEDGFAAIPEHPSIGINAGPLFGALGVLAGGRSGPAPPARAAGSRSRSPTRRPPWTGCAARRWKAYERPEDEVTGNASDGYERRAPGTAGMRDGVRYQFYETSDGHILFQAVRAGVLGELLPRHRPRRPVRDATRARSTPTTPSATSSCARSCKRHLPDPHHAPSGSQFGDEVNTPIVTVNTPKTLADDPQFQDRFPWIPAERLGAEQLPTPHQVPRRRRCPCPTKAPTVGQHTDEVLRDVLGYDAAKVASLRESGALG